MYLGVPYAFFNKIFLYLLKKKKKKTALGQPNPEFHSTKKTNYRQ
jgi:hypothetical protein